MQLPAGSQTWLSCGYDNAWTLMEYLTAAVVDTLQAANWQRSGGKSEQPEPVRRPADLREAGAEKKVRGAKARAFLERQKRSQTAENEEA